ncbi:hypothetical protein TcWFU_007981 [Taenia crassiceps]
MILMRVADLLRGIVGKVAFDNKAGDIDIVPLRAAFVTNIKVYCLESRVSMSVPAATAAAAAAAAAGGGGGGGGGNGCALWFPNILTPHLWRYRLSVRRLRSARGSQHPTLMRLSAGELQSSEKPHDLGLTFTQPVAAILPFATKAVATLSPSSLLPYDVNTLLQFHHRHRLSIEGTFLLTCADAAYKQAYLKLTTIANCSGAVTALYSTFRC